MSETFGICHVCGEPVPCPTTIKLAESYVPDPAGAEYQRRRRDAIRAGTWKGRAA